MESVMAEYTVRVVRQDDETSVQLLVYDDVVAESPQEIVSSSGNSIYQRLFEDTLTALKLRLMVSK